MNKSNFSILFLFLIIFLFSVNVSAVVLDKCSVLNSKNTYYELNKSVSFSGGVCFEIKANNIVLDCKGNSITAIFNKDMSSSYGIIMYNQNNVTIKNCNLINENNSLIRTMIGAGNSTNIKILSNNITSFMRGEAIEMGPSEQSTLYSNIIKGNTINLRERGNGISLINGNYGSNFSNCEITDNNITTLKGTGIILGGFHNGLVANNSIEIGEEVNNYGIRLLDSTNNSFLENRLVLNGNGKYGFWVEGNSNYNLFWKNNVTTYSSGYSDSSTAFVISEVVLNKEPDGNVLYSNIFSFVPYASTGSNYRDFFTSYPQLITLIDQNIGPFDLGYRGAQLHFIRTAFGEIFFSHYLNGQEVVPIPDHNTLKIDYSNFSNFIEVYDNLAVYWLDYFKGEYSANVTFYHIGNRGWKHPAIIVNNTAVCKDCIAFTPLTDEIVKFIVFRKGNYSIGEYIDWDNDSYWKDDCDDENPLIHPGAYEICDGIDNNCNGLIDELVYNLNCGKGICARSVSSCIGGIPQICIPGTPQIETCNNLDDNCNGQTDENLNKSTNQLGKCSLNNQYCSSGNWFNFSNNYIPTIETCNGLDDDCDGNIDEGIANSISGTNVGECRQEIKQCLNGNFVILQIGVGPTNEICDGLDNNCNGNIDEGNVCLINYYCDNDTDAYFDLNIDGTCNSFNCLPLNCRVNTGNDCNDLNVSINPGKIEICNGFDDNCNNQIDEGNVCFVPECDEEETKSCLTGFPGICSSGTKNCIEGLWGGCIQNTLSTIETCNNLDDNCNNQTDEDLGNLTCGIGECRRTIASCINGQTQTCIPGIAQDEICDGLDNNCDRDIDEGNICGECENDDTISCNTELFGECAIGVKTCINKFWGECNQTNQPTTEICNNLDDNCNGQIDENLGSTNCGVGECRRTIANCINGQTQTCVPGIAQDETCNGLDDDCDGNIDEGNICGECENDDTEECLTGLKGICSIGTKTCINKFWATCIQNNQPTIETCNNLDDNCNNQTDENLNKSTNQLGRCSLNNQYCSSGNWFNFSNNYIPKTEICNNLDDNCNGQIDENLGSTNCGVGECRRTIASCINGQTQTCVPGIAQDEICDGLDNNCNNQTDENLNKSTNQLGRCSLNNQYCYLGNWFNFSNNYIPTTEICNNLDDNCNNQTDENLGNLTCGIGECRRTIASCINGQEQICTPGIAQDEICDGLDNNCNNQTDEGNICDRQPPNTIKTVSQPKISPWGQWNDILTNGWFVTSDTTFTLTCNDEGIGCDETYYRINGESWTLYEGAFTLPSDGMYTIEYYSIDLLGNTEAIKSEIDKVDTIAPVTIKTIGNPKYDGTYFITSHTPMVLTGVDSEVGCDNTYYEIYNEINLIREGESEICNASVNWNGLGDGEYTISFYSDDKLNNKEYYTDQNHFVDNSAPSIFIWNPTLVEASAVRRCSLDVLTEIRDNGSGLDMGSINAVIKNSSGDIIKQFNFENNLNNNFYSALISLDGISSGQYNLEITAEDNLGNKRVETRQLTLTSGVYVESLSPPQCNISISQGGSCLFTFNTCIRDSSSVSLWMEKLNNGTIDPFKINAQITKDLRIARVGLLQEGERFSIAEKLNMTNIGCQNINGRESFDLIFDVSPEIAAMIGPGPYRFGYEVASYSC